MKRNFLFIMNSTGTCLWRVYPIAEILRQRGHQVVTMNLSQIAEKYVGLILEWADVLTFQMVSAKDILDRAKKKGIFTIFDCDDLIEKVPRSHPSYKATRKHRYKEDFRYMLEKVDLMTCSTDLLQKRYKEFGEIRKLENYIPAYFWERPKREHKGNIIRIGWAGGTSHQEDLDFIAPIIKKIVAKNKNVKFVYTGGGGWNTQKPDFLWKFGKDHFADIPITRREYCTGSRPEIWPDRLNGMMLDIALAPLDDNIFARHKSQIKYYEYGINHWAGIYQKFLYQNVRHGDTGFLATTPEEWEGYIQKLIDNPSLRKDMGGRAYRNIKNHYTFERNFRLWLETYCQAGERSRHREGEFFVRRK